MFRGLRLFNRCATAQPSKGFQAVHNTQIRKEIQGYASPKLDALVDVLLSLSNNQSQYLNLLITQKSLRSNQSILSSKLLNDKGYKVEPISYIYQQQWAKAEWKDTGLLQFILSDQKEEAGEKVEAEVVKTHYDVELSSVDAAQKIKIIKALRELFNLGLKQAKDMADKAPSLLKKNMKKQEAQKLKKDLEVQGCVVTLK